MTLVATDTRVVLNVVDRSNLNLIAPLSSLIKKHSWGVDYPLDALSFLRNSEHVIAAYDPARVPTAVGCICITTVNGCPDQPNNVDRWLCGWVVHPDHQ